MAPTPTLPRKPGRELPRLDQGRGNHQAVVVGPAHRVEATGTGDQVQEPAFGRAEYPQGREPIEGLHLEGGDAEGRLMAGGVRHIDAVSRLETVEIAEDCRTPDAVQMAIDDRLSGCPGLRAGLQPAGVPDVARDVHETAGGDADGFPKGVDAQRRNAGAIG